MHNPAGPRMQFLGVHAGRDPVLPTRLRDFTVTLAADGTCGNVGKATEWLLRGIQPTAVEQECPPGGWRIEYGYEPGGTRAMSTQRNNGAEFVRYTRQRETDSVEVLGYLDGYWIEAKFNLTVVRYGNKTTVGFTRVEYSQQQ